MKYIVLTLWITIFVATVFPAQSKDLQISNRPKHTIALQKPITGKDYNDRLRKASTLISKKALRTICIQRIHKNGKVIKTVRTVEENDGSGRLRIHTIERSGITERSTDVIMADGFQYSRENGGPWKAVELKPIVESLPIRSGHEKRQLSTRAYFEESTRLGGKPVTVLLSREVWMGMDKLMETRWWIEKNGFLLRQVTTEGVASTQAITSRWINVYHYDNDIKIDIPTK